jgi:hypothetical protein
MKYALLIATVCLPWVTQAAAQDLNGFKITMSKLDVCRYVQEHPTYNFKGETNCPETDNRVVVSIRDPEFSSIGVVALAFDYRGNLCAIWSKFPSSDFNSVYENAVKKFGKPTWNKEYTAGTDGASFPNKLVYWHLKAADIYLERQNKLENGQATGWLALDEPVSFPIIPPASFTIRDTSRNVTPNNSWGNRTTSGR